MKATIKTNTKTKAQRITIHGSVPFYGDVEVQETPYFINIKPLSLDAVKNTRIMTRVSPNLHLIGYTSENISDGTYSVDIEENEIFINL